jgi:hypothetical protein
MTRDDLNRVGRVCFVLLLPLAFLCSTAVGQKPGTNPSGKIIRKNGWTVPGRDDSSTLVRIETTEIEGVEVHKRLLRSYSEIEPLATVDFFTTDSQGNLNISSGLFSVRNMIEYEAKGNIFAYEVTIIPTDAKRDGTRTTLGVAYTFFYVDQDGDGNFETRIDGGQRLSTPAWVKTGNAKASTRLRGQ